jgi:protein LSM14
MPPAGGFGFAPPPVGLPPQPQPQPGVNGAYGQPIPNGAVPGFDPSQRNQVPPQGQQAPGAPRSRNSNGVSTATASLQTVERAIGDLRVSERHGGGRRGRDIKAGDLRVPSTDFDFESSNKRFDKSAIKSPSVDRAASGSQTAGTDSESPAESNAAEAQQQQQQSAYNPKNSFFDSLSASTGGGSNVNERGRGRGRGGRTRREEERERNVATFGEPGGLGLMGPGAYVGGWGGYGRRGGGRGGANGAPREGGRREGGRGRAAAVPARGS